MTDNAEPSIVRNVLKEIGQRCLLKGVTVANSLAAYMVKAVVIHPDNYFNVSHAITKGDVNNLIEICVAKLTEDTSPSLDTIKMQICFDENYMDRDTFEKYYKNHVDNKVIQLVKSIVETKVVSCKEQECLFHKIIACIMHKSGLGGIRNEGAIRETVAATRSIYTATDLENFSRLSKSDKERHLQELMMITSGIRLYNKECDRGGEGIEDLPSLLSELVARIFSNISINLSITEKSLDTLLDVLDHFRRTKRDLPSKLDEQLKQSVINCCQYLLYLKVIKSGIVKSSKSIKHNLEQLSARTDHLHLTISNRSAVPNAQVFPQFACLADIWMRLQRERSYLELLSTLLDMLDEFAKMRKNIMDGEEFKEYEQFAIEDTLPKTEIPKELEPHNTRIQPTNKPDMLVLFPENTSNYSRMPLQFRGYCCWTIVMRDRVLVQGNIDLGIICYKGLCYSFTSNMAAQDFISDPEWYLNAVGVAAKQNLELVQLLELYNLFSSLEPLMQKSPEELSTAEKPILKADFGSQTETHFLESNIVRSYEWNEWQMRKMAISLVRSWVIICYFQKQYIHNLSQANLRRKRTSSTQTKMSSMRRDISTQAYNAKSTETQTKIDARSNVPRPQVFLAGLRGTNPTQYRKVDLTLHEDN